MESGEAGLLGQAVEVIVVNQDIEDVTVPFLKMEVLTVKETMRKTVYVLEEDV